MNLAEKQTWFTFGPQTDDDNVLKAIFAAGATGVRLTFSYGTPDLQLARAERVRAAAAQVGRTNICVVADLQGEKCRFAKIGEVTEIPVTKGRPFILTDERADLSSTPVLVPLQNPRFLPLLTKGDVLVEGDGALLLEVSDRTAVGVECTPLMDGIIHPGRGVSIRTTKFRPFAMTEKDRSDLAYVVRSDAFDMVALSFVGDTADVEDARRLSPSLPLMSKIETPLGVENIDAIAQASDFIMAARGDLALTCDWVELPAGVSRIALACKQNSRPWILATQLAEGLERFTIPTRAEICDLATWMQEGAWGAMLSYETAFGPKPVEAVAAVNRLVMRYGR